VESSSVHKTQDSK